MGMLSVLRQIAYHFFPFLDRYHGVRQFIKFCLVGVSNVAIDVGVYLLLTRGAHWYFLYASLTSFVFAVSWSFYWNRRWTFRVARSDAARQYPKFFLTNATTGTLQNVGLYLLVERLDWYDLLAKGLMIVIVTFLNFSFTKFWTFRR